MSLTQGAAMLVIGGALGWLLAIRWLNARLRSRSLILMDLRGPNMALDDGIRHVRIYARPAVSDDGAAAALIIQAARSGNVSLWRSAPNNTMRRLSRRQLHSVQDRILLSAQGHWRARDGGGQFALLRDEVERMWPRTSNVEITILPAASTST